MASCARCQRNTIVSCSTATTDPRSTRLNFLKRDRYDRCCAFWSFAELRHPTLGIDADTIGPH